MSLFSFLFGLGSASGLSGCETPAPPPIPIERPAWVEYPVHCPFCAISLAEVETPDIAAVSLVCANDHRFLTYFVDHAQLGDPPRPEEIAVALQRFEPNAGTDAELIVQWLSDPYARPYLGDGRARTLLGIYRHHTQYERGSNPPSNPSYCFRCGTSLKGVQGHGVWTLDYQCENGHRMSERGSRLTTWIDGVPVEFLAERSDDVLRSSVEGQLDPPRKLRRFVAPLPASIEGVYRRYLDSTSE